MPKEKLQERYARLNRKFDDELRSEFLDALADKGLIRTACAWVGISEETARVYRNADPDFKTACDEAQNKFLEKLRAAAITRSVDGVLTERVTEIRQDGAEVVREKWQYSDTLMGRLLQRHDKGMVERTESTNENKNTNTNVNVNADVDLKTSLKKLDKEGRQQLREVLGQLRTEEEENDGTDQGA